MIEVRHYHHWLSAKEGLRQTNLDSDRQLLSNACQLRQMLRPAWLAQTGANTLCPSAGQCMPTALLAQDALGGTIVQANVIIRMYDAFRECASITDTQFFNLVSGVEIDLTRSQFKQDKSIQIIRIIQRVEGYPSMRDYLLAYQGIKQKYQLLRNAFDQLYPGFI
jgi:hypothetical protein